MLCDVPEIIAVGGATLAVTPPTLTWIALVHDLGEQPVDELLSMPALHSNVRLPS
jgi:hypothetical protein